MQKCICFVNGALHKLLSQLVFLFSHFNHKQIIDWKPTFFSFFISFFFWTAATTVLVPQFRFWCDLGNGIYSRWYLKKIILLKLKMVKKKKLKIIYWFDNSSDIQAVTQTSETTPVQMKTEQQLELNQQSSLDINNYWEGGRRVIHKHKTSSFLAVYEAASFQRNMNCSSVSGFFSPSMSPSSLYCTWPRHLE